MTVTALAAREIAAVRYLTLVTVLIVLVVVHGVLIWFHQSRSVRDVVLMQRGGWRGTALRYSGPLFLIQCALVAGMTAIFAMGTVDFLRAGDAVPARYAAVALAAAIAVFLGSFLVAVGSGRVRRGRVVLDAEGIRQRGRAFESFLRWEDIIGVRAAYDGVRPVVVVVARPDAEWHRRRTARLWRLDRPARLPMIEIDCLAFALDQNLVHHLVAFYVENPWARSELGTEASLRRV